MNPPAGWCTRSRLMAAASVPVTTGFNGVSSGVAQWERIHVERIAAMTRGSVVAVFFDVDDLRALRLEPERHRLQLRKRAADAGMAIRRGVQEQKSTAAGAGDLSAHGAVGARALVPAIDRVVRGALGHRLLDRPAFVQDFAEGGEIISGQRIPELAGQMDHLLQDGAVARVAEVALLR